MLHGWGWSQLRNAAFLLACSGFLAGCGGGGGGSGDALARGVNLYDINSGRGGFSILGDPIYPTYAIGPAGDVNGDGLGDVVMGSANELGTPGSPRGRTYVVFGKADTGPLTFDGPRTGVGGFVINGIDPGDSSGHAVGGAGDVNGDGLDDIVIGAPNAGNSTGEAYVVFGKSNTGAVGLLSIGLGTGGGFIILNDMGGFFSRFSYLGYNVSGAGDVNGDGYDDVVVLPSTNEPGSAAVVFGKPSLNAVYVSDLVAGSGGFVINAGPDWYGRLLQGAAAGDVNGDGLDDILISDNSYASQIYVVFGKQNTAAVEVTDVAAGIGGYLIERAIYGEGFSSFACAGDVNGDGLADVVIGSSYMDVDEVPAIGQSFVVFGKADTGYVNLDSIASGQGGFVIRGKDYNDTAGGSVSSAGDINGDGLDDLLIGASRAESDGAPDYHEDGFVYVVWGKADTVPVDLAAVERGRGGFVMTGGHARDWAGTIVAPLGDANGDGFSDMLVRAPGVGPGSNSPGATYVVFNPLSPVVE